MDAKEYKAWRLETAKAAGSWRLDRITWDNRKDALFYKGTNPDASDGVYVRINADGFVSLGRYTGAFPHIGEALFQREHTGHIGASGELLVQRVLERLGISELSECAYQHGLISIAPPDAPKLSPEEHKRTASRNMRIGMAVAAAENRHPGDPGMTTTADHAKPSPAESADSDLIINIGDTDENADWIKRAAREIAKALDENEFVGVGDEAYVSADQLKV